MPTAHDTAAPGLVVVVSTADRPEVLQRCIALAVSDCSEARAAHWIVLDDSASSARARNLEVVEALRRTGLTLSYVDEAVERELQDMLPTPAQREAFAQLIVKRTEHRLSGVRNLALLTGLALEPRTLLFLDDDIVHRHGTRCFLHWAVAHEAAGSFIAAARQRGIRDMDYASRLALLLQREDWPRFAASHALTGPAAAWYGPDNPLWKVADGAAPSPKLLEERPVLSGGVLALRNTEARWLPFPYGYNEDIQWSVLQSAVAGTPLLRVDGIDVSHLPPAIGHRGADTLVTQLLGAAITQALRASREPVDSLLQHLPAFQDHVCEAMRQEVFRLLAVEGLILRRRRVPAVPVPERERLAAFDATVAGAKRLLRDLDVARRAFEWLQDVDRRCAMFATLRESETAQAALRNVVLSARTTDRLPLRG